MNKDRKRKRYDLKTKLKIINCVELNVSYDKIMCDFDLKNKSNICRIFKDREKIKNMYENDAFSKKKV